jgi:thymidylate synthase (FAD)
MITATYIDHMGTDLSVLNAARVSFGKKSEMEEEHGVWKLKDGDVRLINYLAKHGHYSPFGHCFASFHVKAPVFVARQLVKHKFLRWNEISRRYVDNEPEFYVPDVWRGRSKNKKQGSEGTVYTEATLVRTDYYDYGGAVIYTEYNNIALGVYKDLLDDGVAPEQARMVLPQSMMTEWWWSGSLDAFADMCNLRCKGDAQYESRLVADQIDTIMLGLYPVSWGALRND